MKDKTLTLLQVSDLHLEFSNLTHLERNWPEADVLALCGDIGVGLAHRDFVVNLCNSGKYRHVFLVTGNHEYYNKVVEDVDLRWKEVAAEVENLHFLNGEGFVELENHVFAACTLWSDLSKPEHSALAQFYMNDYKLIRSLRAYPQNLSNEEFKQKMDNFDIDDHNTWHFASPASRSAIINNTYARPAVICPKTTTAFFNKDVAYLWDVVKANNLMKKKLVVFTHHTPAEICLNPEHSGGALDKAYTSDLSDLMQHVDVWGCGHTHRRLDEMVGTCRVLMNCRGYVQGSRRELEPFRPVLKEI